MQVIPIKEFPINTATACRLKWTWSSIWLNNGKTASCHRIDPHTVTLDNFDNFHNTPEKIKHRQIMLDGKWPSGGCRACQTMEESGGTSDRLQYLEKKWDYWTPPELENNPHALEVTPRIVEVFINNTCNLKCVYCSYDLSSAIEKETVKFGKYNGGRVVALREVNSRSDHILFKPQRPNYVNAFFDWLKKNHNEVRHLHLLGGEPFLEPEFDRFLDFFIDNPSPNLGLVVFSNLMTKEVLMQHQINKLAKLLDTDALRWVQITGSIDGWGPMSEYTRNGLDINVFDRNMKYILQSTDKFQVGISQTLTPLTLKETVPLLEKINEWQQYTKKQIGFGSQFQTVEDKDCLHFKNWDCSIFEEDFTNVIKIMSKYNKDYAPHIQSLWDSIKDSKPNIKYLKEFCMYFDELDRRRNTNWRETFPHLMENINVYLAN